MSDPQNIPLGLCQCGCGQRTNLARQNNAERGWVLGQPYRYCMGHNNRGKRKSNRYRVEDRGHDTPCWIWQLGRQEHGYGLDWNGGKRELAHRAMWKRMRGAIPEGLELDHLCRQPACCNPDHLEPVTRFENARRGRGTKLTWEAVRAIRASDETQCVLAERYGVTQPTISEIRSGHTWKED